ncbi:hypothetical protein BN1723_020048, partial [Verticillium longisporum]
EARRRSHQHC